MCLTGNTGLELASQDSLAKAVVASQPALPFLRPAALGISSTALRRLQTQGTSVLAFRFTHDSRSPHERLARLQEVVGEHFAMNEIDSRPENSSGLKKTAHAVFTTEFVDEADHPTRIALDQLVQFSHDELRRRASTGTSLAH